MKKIREWLETKMAARGYWYRAADMHRETGIRHATLLNWLAERPTGKPNDDTITQLALWAGVEPPEVYEVFGVSVPADYSQARFRWLALAYGLSDQDLWQMAREAELWRGRLATPTAAPPKRGDQNGEESVRKNKGHVRKPRR